MVAVLLVAVSVIVLAVALVAVSVIVLAVALVVVVVVGTVSVVSEWLASHNRLAVVRQSIPTRERNPSVWPSVCVSIPQRQNQATEHAPMCAHTQRVRHQHRRRR